MIIQQLRRSATLQAAEKIGEAEVRRKWGFNVRQTDLQSADPAYSGDMAVAAGWTDTRSGH